MFDISLTLWLCSALHKYLTKIILQTKASEKSQKVTHSFLNRYKWRGSSDAAMGEGYWCWLNHLRMTPMCACGPLSRRHAMLRQHALTSWCPYAAVLGQNAEQQSCSLHRRPFWFLIFFFFFSTAVIKPLISDTKELQKDMTTFLCVLFLLDKCTVDSTCIYN